jgi:hypothetical protein
MKIVGRIAIAITVGLRSLLPCCRELMTRQLRRSNNRNITPIAIRTMRSVIRKDRNPATSPEVMIKPKRQMNEKETR